MEAIPLLYLVLGLVCLLRAPERLTYRDRHASWRRMLHAAFWSAGFTGLMVLAELAYLILYAKAAGASPGREGLYLLGELACLGLSVGLGVFLRKTACIPTVE